MIRKAGNTTLYVALLSSALVASSVLWFPAGVALEQGDAEASARAESQQAVIMAEWNDFTAVQMLPDAADIRAHTVPGSPISERSVSVSRIARAVNSKYVTQGLSDYLIPLTDWELKIGNMPADRQPTGNVFLVRHQVSPYIVQVSEGLGCVIVEVRKIDGTRLVEPDADLAAYALNAAQEWLCDAMQPRKDVHRILKQWALGVARWIPDDVPDPSDKMKFTYEVCRAYTDGVFLRYEVRGCLVESSHALALPEPDTFGVSGNP